jgi:GNAT superfamily N-acetyltransferase
MQLTIRDNLDGVDGAALKQFYVDADFDNGRTPEQYAVSFGNSVVRLAYEGETLVGVARAIWDGVKCAAIFDVAVLPKHRRQGVGRRLMRSLVDAMPNAFIILTTSRGREPFYANFGFEPTPDRFPALVRNDDL